MSQNHQRQQSSQPQREQQKEKGQQKGQQQGQGQGTDKQQPSTTTEPDIAYFTNVRYFITGYSASRIEELEAVLDKHGGERVDALEDASHVVTNTDAFVGCEIVEGKGVNVVTDKWVERSIIMKKAQETRYYCADPQKIFSGVVANSEGLSAHDTDLLSAGIFGYGGRWCAGLTRDCTHLFVIGAKGLASDKYATAMHYQPETNIRILIPHWFDDSLRLGCYGLPTQMYEWPHPEVLLGPKPGEGEGEDAVGGVGKSSQPTKLDPSKKNLYRTALLGPSPSSSSVIETSPGYTSLPPSSLHAIAKLKPVSNVWQGRRLLLSHTLGLTGDRKDAVEASVVRFGGVVVWVPGSDATASAEERVNEGGGMTEDEADERELRLSREEVKALDECDVYVTRFRKGKAYVEAVKSNKPIGTLSWVFYVHTHGSVTSPVSQLLHYPNRRERPEGEFAKHVITITNYTGDARDYIKRLILTMGADFTPSMSMRNTVLIAANLVGTKATRAASWSIPVVNHTWLEDCYVAWKNLTPANPKYIQFPDGVDFVDVLGQRGISTAELKEEAGEVEREWGEWEAGVVRRLRGEKGLGEGGGGDGDGGDGEDELSLPPVQKMSAKARGKQRERLPWEKDAPLTSHTSTSTPVSKLGKRRRRQGDDGAEEDGHTFGKGYQLGREQDDGDGDGDVVPPSSLRRPPTSAASSSSLEGGEKTVQGTVGRAFKPPTGSINFTANARSKSKSKPPPPSSSQDNAEARAKEHEHDLTPPRGTAGCMMEVEDAISLDPAPVFTQDFMMDESQIDLAVHRPGVSARGRGRGRGRGDEEGMDVDEQDDDDEGEEEVEETRGPGKKVTTFSSKSKAKSNALPQRDLPASSLPPSSLSPSPTRKQVQQQEDSPSQPTPGSAKPKSKGSLFKPASPLKPTFKTGRGQPGVTKPAASDIKNPEEQDEEDEEDAEEEEEGDDVDEDEERVMRAKSKSKSTTAAVAGQKAKAGGGKNRRKRRTSLEEEERGSDEEDEEEEEAAPPSRSAAKRRGSRGAVSFTADIVDISEDEDDDEKEAPSRRSKPKSPVKKNGKAAAITKKASSSRKANESDEASQEDDDDSPSPPPKSRSKSKTAARKSTSSKSHAHDREPSPTPTPTASPAKKKKTTKSIPLPIELDSTDEEIAAPMQATQASFVTKSKAKSGTGASASRTASPVKSKSMAAVEVPPLVINNRVVPTSSLRLKETDDGAGKKDAAAPRRGSEGGGKKLSSGKAVYKSSSKTKSRAPLPDDVRDFVTDDENDEDLYMTHEETPAPKPSTSAKRGKTQSTPARKTTKKRDIPPRSPSHSSTSPSEETPAPVETPATTSGRPKRGASERAKKQLHDVLIPDLVNYEQQRKHSLKNGMKSFDMDVQNSSDDDAPPISAKRKGKEREKENTRGKRKNGENRDDEEEERGTRKKRRVSKGDEEDAAEDVKGRSAGKKQLAISARGASTQVDEKQPGKVMSPVKKPPKPVFKAIIRTSLCDLDAKTWKALEKLGARQAKDSDRNECTHLVVKKIVRTETFLVALTFAPFVVHEKWVKDSLKQDKLLPETSYLIKDPDGEATYKFKLENALANAMRNRGSLFSHHTFYISKVAGKTLYELFERVVQASGGQVSRTPVNVQMLKMGKTADGTQTRHFVSTSEEKASWKAIADAGFPVYGKDIILTSALRQEFDWKSKEFILPECLKR